MHVPKLSPSSHTGLPMRASLSITLVSLLLLGCGKDAGNAREGSDTAGENGGTVVIAAAGEADILLPPLVESAVADAVTDMVFDPLAAIGAELNTIGDRGFQPRLAERWSWAPDSLSITFHVNPRARWHDGAPVRARDITFSHGLYMDPATGSPIAANLASIDSVTARDSMTVVFWFKRRTPEQFHDAAYSLVILPEHLLANIKPADLRASAFARAPVGTGRFRFLRWEPGTRLELTSDTANYRGRARLDRVIFAFAPDFTAAATKLFAGEADFFETLRPEQLSEIAKHSTLRTVPYQSLDYAYVQFNLRSRDGSRPHPILGDRELRRALSMAVDRERMVKNVFDSLAVVGVGPGPRGQSSTDTTITQLRYDTLLARRMLDSLGWRDGNGDGVREKNARPLEFTLAVPSSSRNRVRLAVLLQEQLRGAGVKLNIEEMEYTTFLDRMSKRNFDAIFGAAHTDPSPVGIRQAWSSAAAAKNGSNVGSYRNAVFDAQVDSALTTMDPAASRRYFRAVFQTIVDDAPAIWMYEPRLIAGVHRRLRTPEMRPDGWWQGIADWSIPAGERIERDRIGLRAPVASGGDSRADSTRAR